MSVIGKGRGRGFADVRDGPLRQPGQIHISKFHDLINLIDDLFIIDSIFTEKIDKIMQTIENFSKINSMKEIFEDLHKQALDDRQFGIKLAIACSNPKIYTLNDCSLRLILLQALQKDYEEREQIKKRSIVQFRNAISLLGGVYCNLQINSKPVNILSTPLLHYLELLLDASEEEDIELITIQIFINGSKLFEQSPLRSDNFLISIRQVLINRNLSAKSRAMLLYIIDSSNQSFRPLVGGMREFYFNKLDGNSFTEIENLVNNIVNGTKLTNDGFESHDFSKCSNLSSSIKVENNFVSVNVKTSQREIDMASPLMEKSLLYRNNEKPSAPRAIRGVGAVDSAKDKHNKKSPRGKKDKMNDEQMWLSKSNTSSRIWGHDDRFDKDYTQT